MLPISQRPHHFPCSGREKHKNCKKHGQYKWLLLAKGTFCITEHDAHFTHDSGSHPEEGLIAVWGQVWHQSVSAEQLQCELLVLLRFFLSFYYYFYCILLCFSCTVFISTHEFYFFFLIFPTIHWGEEEVGKQQMVFGCCLGLNHNNWLFHQTGRDCQILTSLWKIQSCFDDSSGKYSNYC